MTEKYNININTPCSEKFDNFKKTRGGGYCFSCQKEVTDFTKMNDNEILSYLSNSKEKTCGRFNEAQLKTYTHTIASNSKQKSLGIGLASFSLLSLLSINESKAQSNEKLLLLNTENKESTLATDKDTPKNNSLYTSVTGVITGSGFPLPGVNIHLKGTSLGAASDFDGFFKISGELKPGDIIIFSSLGFKTKEYIIPKNFSNHLNLSLESLRMEKGLVCVLGEVNVEKVYSSKRTLWQKIKNRF